MPKVSKSQNRHPVDMLADVRAQIKVLESQERALRDDILRTGDTNGDENVAMVKHSSRNLLDRPMLEARFGRDEVAKCTKESPATTLTLYKKAVDVLA